MSGEILLLDGPGGSASRLVDALQTLTKEVPLGPSSPSLVAWPS